MLSKKKTKKKKNKKNTKNSKVATQIEIKGFNSKRIIMVKSYYAILKSSFNEENKMILKLCAPNKKNPQHL